MKKRYYVEICSNDDSSSYILQSKWYNTKHQALKFMQNIELLDDDYGAYLMCADWDETTTDIGDIECLGKI